MKHWSIRSHIIAAVPALVGGLSLLYSAQGFYSMGRLISIYRERVAEELGHTIRGRMSTLLRSSDLALEPIVADTHVRSAFAGHDRDALRKLLLPMWPALHEKGIAQFQFHLPPATSFLRLHEPEKYGDDLSSFRSTVVKANAEHKMVMGLEEGRGGFGLRIVRPMVDSDNSYIGTVEFGLDFGKKFLEDLKADYGGEYFLYRFADTGKIAWKNESLLLGGTQDKDPFPFDRPPVSTDWQAGKTVERRSGNFFIVIVPVADYSGQTVGLIKAHLDLGAFESQRNLHTAFFIATGLLGAGLGIFLAFFLVRQTIRPLARCTELTDQISRGDLTVQLDSKRSDEIGTIYRSLDHMRVSLADFLGAIGLAIKETMKSAKDLEIGTAEVTLSAQQVSKTMEVVASDSIKLSELARGSRETAQNLLQSASDVRAAAIRTSQESASVLQASKQVAAAARISNEMIDRLTILMSRSAESVQALGSSLEKIGEFTGSIQNISDEINLLSLNASIEAARAGDAGRGFAVVAQHVSRLAEESGKAVKDIQRTIEDVMKESDSTSQAILSGNREMEEGVRGVRDALTSVGTIESMLEQVDSYVATITQTAERQSSEAPLVVQSMEKISGLIEAFVASSEEVAASMEQISGLMVSLKNEAATMTRMAQQAEQGKSMFHLSSDT